MRLLPKEAMLPPARADNPVPLLATVTLLRRTVARAPAQRTPVVVGSRRRRTGPASDRSPCRRGRQAWPGGPGSSAIPARSWALLLAGEGVDRPAPAEMRAWAPQVVEQGPVPPRLLQGVGQHPKANGVQRAVGQALLVRRLGQGARPAGHPARLDHHRPEGVAEDI